MSHLEIIDNIVANIYFKGMPNGAQLESIPKLCETYGVSDQTVQKALKKLKQDDILFSRPGKGVFVKNREKLDAMKTFLKIAVMDPDTKRFIPEVIADFEQEHRNVKISWKNINQATDMNEVISDYAPDIIIFETSNVYNFIHAEIAESITDASSYLTDVCPGLALPCCSRNELYAVPLFFSPVFVVYNKKIMKDAGVNMPRTWDMDTCVAIADKLTNRSSCNRRFGFVLSLSLYRFPALIAAFGGNLRNLPGSLEGIKKALDFSMALFDKNISPFIPDWTADNSDRFCFTEGYGAMRLETFHGLRIRDRLAFEWDLMQLPRGEKNGSSCFAANYAGIPKISGNKSFAREFISHLFSEKTQKNIKRKHFLLPARKSVCDDNFITPDGFCPANYSGIREEFRDMQPIHNFFIPETKNLFTKEMFLFFNKIKSSIDVLKTLKEAIK